MRSYSKRILAILQGAACLILFVGLLQPTTSAYAHPADMYIQSQSIVLDGSEAKIDWRILPGPFLADGAWAAADQDHNGTISSNEALAWVTPFLSQFIVQLGGRTISPANTLDIHWPASVDVLRTGEDAIEVTLHYTWPDGVGGVQAFALHNAHFEANSLNWFEIQSQAGVTFDQPSQNNGLLQLNIFFPALGNATPPATDVQLTSWNSGTPNLPSGFSSKISKLAGNLAADQSNQAPSPAAQGSNYATAVTSALVGLVKVQQFSPLFLAGAFLLSLALGCLHALTPGHGKALVGAYLVGSQGRVQDAVFLGGVVTITHTGSVLVLGLITLLASHYILPALIIPWLEIISGLFVIAFGINLFLQRRGDLVAWFSNRNKQRPARVSLDLRTRKCGSTNLAPRGRSILPQTPGLPHDHDHNHDHVHAAHGIHDHTHSADDGSAHAGHSHVPPGKQVTTRSLLTLGISGGLVPCPDAIAILLVAVAVNRVPFGMLLIVAFSVGLALVLIGIGIAMVQGARWIGHSDVLTRFGVFTPVVSAIVVSGLGIGLTITAFNSFRFTSAVMQPVASQGAAPRPISQGSLSTSNFDIKGARILYVAADAKGFDQLFMKPVYGGNAVQYTQETGGITGYSISPDGKTILYTVFNLDGGSSIGSINADGTQRHIALDCPQSECNSPEWYPDGLKIVYEHLDDAQDASLPRFSIWWLDLATAKTQPVFKDQGFASTSAKFSYDGQWLGYVSVANNTIVMYHLSDGRNLSIPLGFQSAIPESWSPTGNALLYGSPADANGSSPLHVKVYAVDSGKTLDLGGSVGAIDYSAAWSPDGQWIAIDRNIPGSDGSQANNQVWLVKPDGTQAHVLLQEGNVSYSDLSWSPDGAYLLYSRYTLDYSNQNAGHFDVAMADIRTGQEIILAPGGDLARFLP